MPIIDDVTPNLGLSLPNADNFLADDVTRLRNSLTAIDSAVAAKANAASTITALAGKADLVSGKVPASQLPAYVDDVIEVANLASMPTTGETGKIYVTLDTNKQYRWSGSVYIEISKSPGTTDDVAEGTTNKYFTEARALNAIPAADAGTFGKVKIGAGLGIDSNGALFASAGSGSIMTVVEIVPPSNGLASVTVPSGYSPGTILVGVDGVILPPSDYTATNGTSIGFVGFTVGTTNTVIVVKLATVTLANLPAGSVGLTQIADGVLPYPFRNRLINGLMAFDQENNGSAVTVTAGGTTKYVLDQWYASCTGANISSQRVTGTSGPYAAKLTGAASNTGTLFGQRMEGDSVAHMANGNVTVSLMVASSSITTMTWKAYSANVKDNFAAKTQIATGSFSVSSTLSAKTFSFNPGANAGNGIAIEFETGALLASQTIQYEKLQFELGSTASVFEYRPDAIELVLCQKHFWAFGYTSNVSIYTAAYGTAGNIYIREIALPTKMRVNPTVTIDAFTVNNCSSPVLNNSSTDSIVIQTTVIATGRYVFFNGAANTGIKASARL